MELCGEPDIFIGRRTNKFRRYSGLLEQPVPFEEHKNLRRSTRRRITIGSYDESSHDNFNNNVPMSEKYCKNKLPGDEEKICNKPVPTKQTFTSSRRNRRKSFNLNCAFIEDDDNNENILASEIISPNPVLTKQPCKRCKGRKPRKSFDLNCTFIEDESQTPETQLHHQTLPDSRKYSLRSSLNTFNHDPKKSEDFGENLALHPMNDLLSIASENKNNEKVAEHQNVNLRKSSDSICVPSEEAETIQFPKLPYNNRSHSLQSSRDAIKLRNEDFVTLRKNNKYEGEDDIKEPLENIDLRINQIPKKLRSISEFNYTNNSVNQTEQNNSRMSSADVNCTLIAKEKNNQISEFQSGRHYSLKSSLGAFEHNLNKYEQINSNCTQPIESAVRSGEKTEEILLILEYDGSAQSEKLQERIALPSTQGEENKECPVRINQRVGERKYMNRRKYCGANCRYLKNTEKIATEPYSDNKSYRFPNTSDNKIKRNESFVTDKKTNEYISVLTNTDKDNQEILQSTNNRTEARQKKIEPNDCNMLLDAKISSSPRKDYVSGDNFGQSFIKNNSEMVFREAYFNQNGLVEKWIRSHFHLNPNKQSARKWESLSTLEQKPPHWNGSPNQFTQQEGKHLCKIDIRNMDESSSQSNTPPSNRASREGGKEQYNQENHRKPNRKNTFQEESSDLETIQTNTPSPEKTSKAGGRKQGNQGKPKIYRKNRLQKRSSNLETIFEIPQEEMMSGRKFKRSIDFDNFNSLARVRRRKIKAKKVNPLVYRDIVDVSKLNAILDKLSLSD